MDGEFLSTSFMMDIVEKNTTTRKGIDVLALLIYGLVLFPRREEYVHMSVTTLFMEIKHQSDPILTILAETIRSLNACRKAGGKFKACG